MIEKSSFHFFDLSKNCHLYHYAGNNPVRYVDPDGLEIWNSSTLTRDEYDKNYQLQRQYSWEQVQQYFADNPKGIIYRYDTVLYYLGKSNNVFPNMEKPNVELAYVMVGLTKAIGTKIGSWIKNGITSALASGIVDTLIQYKKMAEKGNQNFNTTELFNATAGGFVSGFVSTGISSIPIGNPTDANGSIMLSNLFGGVSGSMTSQLLYNVQNGKSFSNEMGEAYLYGAGGGFMVGGFNIFYPSPLPSNIGQVLKNSIKEEFINTATGQAIREKLNETHTTFGN